MPKNLIIPLNSSSEKTGCDSPIKIRIDSIRIRAEEYHEMLELTIRCSNDADAIFSVVGGGGVFPSTRSGKCPESERIYLPNTLHILSELKRSLQRYREKGGRLFVDKEGAYWKGSMIEHLGVAEIKRFAEWAWVDHPPEPKPTCTYQNSGKGR